MTNKKSVPSLFHFHQGSTGFLCRISAPMDSENLLWLKEELMEEYSLLAGASKKLTFYFETPMSAQFLEEMLFFFSALKSSGYEIAIKSETFTPDFQSPEI